MKYPYLLILLLGTINSFSQDKTLAFDVNNYPSETYDLKTQTYNFREFEISIVHVKPKTSNQPRQFNCRYWLLVKSGTKVIDGRYYADSEALGGCSGIYADKLQPKDYFILTKFGDYNGELLIIDKTGKIQKYFGGMYHISDDSKYLFSTYDSDLSGMTIFDLSQNKLIFTSDSLDSYIYGIYYKDGKYFGIAEQEVKIPFKSVIYTFDNKSVAFNRSVVDDKYVKTAKQLKSSKLPDDNCNCGNVGQ